MRILLGRRNQAIDRWKQFRRDRRTTPMKHFIRRVQARTCCGGDIGGQPGRVINQTWTDRRWWSDVRPATSGPTGPGAAMDVADWLRGARSWKTARRLHQ
jgi:hypothetical protein